MEGTGRPTWPKPVDGGASRRGRVAEDTGNQRVDGGPRVGNNLVSGAGWQRESFPGSRCKGGGATRRRAQNADARSAASGDGAKGMLIEFSGSSNGHRSRTSWARRNL